MEKLKKENLIEETTDSEQGAVKIGFEIPVNEARKIVEELSRINDLINYDEIIKIEDLGRLALITKKVPIDIGGEIMTVEEAEKNPNVKIWAEILRGDMSHMNELTEINKKVAEVLSKSENAIFLSNIKLLAGDVAKIFSSHRYYLQLNGLQAISDTVAEFLSKHHATLDLDSVTHLSDSAALSFSKHHGGESSDGVLSFKSLVNITDNGAKYLALHSKLYAPEVKAQIAKYKK